MRANLTVKREDFDKAFIQLARLCEPGAQEQAVLSFDGQTFQASLGGMSVMAPARGSMEGQARVSGKALMALGRVRPEQDPVCIEGDVGFIRIGPGFRLRCVWQSAGSAAIQLPMNPPLTMILALPMNYTRDQVAASGLEEVFQDAERKRDRALASAAGILREFGVEPSALRCFVDGCIRRMATERPDPEAIRAKRDAALAEINAREKAKQVFYQLIGMIGRTEDYHRSDLANALQKKFGITLTGNPKLDLLALIFRLNPDHSDNGPDTEDNPINRNDPE
ncbi:MAG: hypothetical protein GXY42_06595 [Desulfovibrionales bacterium]|nr:hypothetical protein [Desulfovibrionales bacterium]